LRRLRAPRYFDPDVAVPAREAWQMLVAPGNIKSASGALGNLHGALPGFGVRGGDIDKQGRVWVSLASGHMGVFDRCKCKGPLNGPPG
jgi:hypothetical protein